MKAKQIVIIGGTGTLGKALTKAIEETWLDSQVTILSRDEHKQAQMKRDYPNVQFHIADVRDYDSIAPHLMNKDVVFHVAAMKHVDLIEANPVEAIKTNVQGTYNVARACIAGKVPFCAYSSTDKAVDPINTYGFTKALGEKLLFHLNQTQKLTKFGVYRWGNILGSQGSVIPQFIKTLKDENKVYITHAAMTRFWLPIDWPVTYMMRTYAEPSPTQAMIPPVMKASPVHDIVDVLASMLGKTDYTAVIIGMRPGEKIDEAMKSRHEDSRFDSFHSERYTREELKELLRPLVEASA